MSTGKWVTKHFSKKELECPCCKVIAIHWTMLRELEALRTRCGFPLPVTSGYRCEKYNRELGGVENSQHCRGLAVDIAILGAHQRYTLVKHALSLGFRGIGVYANFIHIDFRKERQVMWRG